MIFMGLILTLSITSCGTAEKTDLPEKDADIDITEKAENDESDAEESEEDFEAKLNYNGDDYDFSFCYESADGLGIVTYKDFPPQTKGKIQKINVETRCISNGFLDYCKQAIRGQLA